MKRMYDSTFNFNQFDTDMNYEIMLRTPITYLQSLCTSNQYYYQLCQNKHFWLNKLQYDHLVLPSTQYLNQHQSWIKIYKVLAFITNYIDLIKNKNNGPIFVDQDLFNIIQFFNQHHINLDIDVNNIADIGENITTLAINQYGDDYVIEFEYNKEWEEDDEEEIDEISLVNFDVMVQIVSHQQLIDLLFDGLMRHFMYV